MFSAAALLCGIFYSFNQNLYPSHNVQDMTKSMTEKPIWLTDEYQKLFFNMFFSFYPALLSKLYHTA